MEYTKEYLNEKIKQHTQKLYQALRVKVEHNHYLYAEPNEVVQKFEPMASELAKLPGGELPSKLIKKKFSQLVNLYIPNKQQEHLYYILDNRHKWSYTRGVFRRSVRSLRFLGISEYYLANLFVSFYNLTLFCDTTEQYVTHTWSEEGRAIKEMLNEYDLPKIYQEDDLIAAELDLGNTNLANALEDIMMSETNTSTVTFAMIRGIVKSSNARLHKVLGDFLLAARLQEGVRQAICENMDEGTVEAFLTLLDVIADNGLIRYSAVKRAIGTWTGICDETNTDRITFKMLELMKEALHNEAYRKELLRSNDTIALYIGLWTTGFYEVYDAVALVKHMVREGTRNQKLTASYYNIAICSTQISMESSRTVIESCPDDIELCAAFFTSYMDDFHSAADYILYGQKCRFDRTQEYAYHTLPYSRFFESPAQAKRHFGLLRDLYQNMPKKGYRFFPCIFPWYGMEISRSEVLKRMVLIACMLEEPSLVDFLCPLISEIDTGSRRRCVRMLLHAPNTKIQRNTLVLAIGDKETYTREEAFELVDSMELEEEDFSLLQSLLKYKSKDVRSYVLELLTRQGKGQLTACIQELLSGSKEGMRAGGLDLIIRVKNNATLKDLLPELRLLAQGIPNPTEQERIIMEEITGDSQADLILKEKGYGLYDPEVEMSLPEFKADPKEIGRILHMKKKEMYPYIEKLNRLITENQLREYKVPFGEERLLRDGYEMMTYSADTLLGGYPFPELWLAFYEKEIREFHVLLNLAVLVNGEVNAGYARNSQGNAYSLAKKVFGKEYMDVDLSAYTYGATAGKIIINLYYYFRLEHREECISLGRSIHGRLLQVPLKDLVYKNPYQRIDYVIRSHNFTLMLLGAAMLWETDEEFKEIFIMSQTINSYYKEYDENIMQLDIFDYIKAYQLNLIPEDCVYHAVFHTLGLEETFRVIKNASNKSGGQSFGKRFQMDGDDWEESLIFQKAYVIYWNVVEMILKVELKRSEMPTPFSDQIRHIFRIRGMKYFVDILAALGNDALSRNAYYYYSFAFSASKPECLSILLRVSEPLPGEDGLKLKEYLKDKKITDRRLIEAAMYNPKWVDAVEAYIGWSGLKSGIYYFMAHMNERFYDKKTAMIAKYTPLTTEELNMGAFDIDWFRECYQKLGEKRFQIAYQSAKYISDGNKHTRARKYADAVLGKVEEAELEKLILEKRNKDLLMSYALLPIQTEKRILHRYQFLQEFLKGSKQFGAQRRASEGIAVKMGMQNLAINAGYTDVTRLILNMETKLVENLQSYFAWKEVGEVHLSIDIGGEGRTSIICKKDDKQLKSIPSRLKKDPCVLELKEINKQLRDQHSRTKAMLEQFMEDEVEFTVSEIKNLGKNPIVYPLLKDLVYLSEDNSGFLMDSSLVDWKKKVKNLTPKMKIRIAHPYYLWKERSWHEYQKILFEQKIKQPFKQVFREVYVKTAEEQERGNSLRYAGNQIQPKKTAACLKARRWVADYEDGLQKIYYKENIVARIYALADWFSPSDIEAPTLEWVEFSDRKTFQPIKIKDIPDVIFSEVMRDVDFAVSVAHAGGVDPETSHSTIEMRKAIIEFNLPLFGLTNVSFTEKHALIAGVRGNYSIHLGSGVIFNQGGTHIPVLPVHSQRRGKLFLPFLDEDPKTAEIMSKVVLFAEDVKIKDPYILNSIHECPVGI